VNKQSSEHNSSKAEQLTKYILLHAYSRTTAVSSCASSLSSCHNSIFGYKLRTH